MNILPAIAAAKDEMVAIYRDLHANPELGFEETRTSKIVAEKLAEYGVDEVHTGLGKTGVVADTRKIGGNDALVYELTWMHCRLKK